MAGHSKWNNIKNRKEKSDAQRGKIFTKIGREIAIAVKEGGGDPASNSKLRDVIAKAKAANMPNDNITRSIKKASGESDNVNYEEIVYEGYGSGGVAVIVSTVTDNRNRTAGEMRYIFDRNGGSIGTSGCVSWMFDRKGVITIEKADGIDADELMLLALDGGAEDFNEYDDSYEVITDPAEFSPVREALEGAGYTFVSAEVEMLPQTTVAPEGEAAQKVMELLEKFEDHDDVQNVYSNAEFSE
ncbi:MAG: YebC/PmpR family DNA-binding transcriptional regulator [Christensenellales bacterium]|jgi:YebC/PmpR family DNA-binding regulatory protein